MARLHLLPETPESGDLFACAEVRLTRPYQHATMAADIEPSVGHSLPSSRLDVVVTQRSGPIGWTLDDVAALVRDARRRSIRLVYDLDDDLLTRHPVPAVDVELELRRARVRFLLREADLVTVATPALAARVARFNANVAVWPNALDEALVSEERAKDPAGVARIDMGYVGTFSHLPDLMWALESLQEALADRAVPPSAELWGISDDPRLGVLLAGAADVRTRQAIGNYTAFHRALAAAGWRVGLAPLADNAFNLGKSDIKFLDYALAGIAGVYADAPAYATVVDGHTGLKADARGFGAAARRLLDDEGLRREIVATAREHVLSQRTLRVCAPALRDLVLATLDRAAAAGVAPAA